MILLRQLAFHPDPAVGEAEPATGHRRAAREVPLAAKKPAPEPPLVTPSESGPAPLSAPAPETDGITLSAFAPRHWPRVCSGLRLGGVVGNTADNLELVAVTGAELMFRLDAGSASLYEDGHRQRLQEALSGYFGTAVTVRVEVGALQSESPRAAALRAERERHAAAVAALRADPVVGALVEHFDGVLLEDTVVPLDE